MNDASRQHRSRIRRAAITLLGLAAIAATATGCQSLDGGQGAAPGHAGSSATAPSGSPTSAPGGAPPAGSAVVRPAPDPGHRPTYAISAAIDPARGSIDGRLTVHVPQGVGGDQLRFRVLANADGYGG